MQTVLWVRISSRNTLAACLIATALKPFNFLIRTDDEMSIFDHNQHHAVVTLVDANEADAISRVRESCRRYPFGKVLVMSADLVDGKLLEFIEAGCHGFFSPRQDTSELATMIRALASGETFCSAQVSTLVFKKMFDKRLHDNAQTWTGDLTARELEVLRLVASGFSNKEIAVSLSITLHTVKNHVHHILGKLNVSRRRQLINWQTMMSKQVVARKPVSGCGILLGSSRAS